jgi:hypothetical protein
MFYYMFYTVIFIYLLTFCLLESSPRLPTNNRQYSRPLENAKIQEKRMTRAAAIKGLCKAL